MADENKNGIPDETEQLRELANSLGVSITVDSSEKEKQEDFVPVFAGEKIIPTYDSTIGVRGQGRIPVEVSKSKVLGDFAALPEKDIRRLRGIAKSIGMDTNYTSLKWLWGQATNDVAEAYSRGRRVSIWDYLESMPGEDVGTGSGVGGVSRSITMANARDLRSTADAIGAEVLGRAITDEEFQKVLRRVRTVEQAEPTVTRRTGAGTVTESGLTAEGRKDLITEMLMKGPEAKEFTQATTMMDAFYQALSEGPSGS